MSRATIAGWAAWLLVCGCGGQAERGPDDSSGDMPAEGSKAGGSTPSDGTPLGVCVAGFNRYENLDKACNWLAGDLCYDTKEQACACICPRDKNSLCLSGLPSPGSATPVSCD